MATYVPPQHAYAQRTPSDYHPSLGELDEPIEQQQQPTIVIEPPPTEQPSVMIVDNQANELAAFEKGRMQGELEAARRAELEAPMQQKVFQDTTVRTVAQPDIVEINRLTFAQWTAAIFGEIFSAAYIVLMAIWIANYRAGGVGWSNSKNSGDLGTFNTHVLVSFIGLWFVSQAYLTYRLLPVNTPPILQKLWYVGCHLCALACFGLAIAGAVMSQPGSNCWSVHAWVSFLAVAIYAAHAFYSSFKVMIAPHGVWLASNWNETPNDSLTPEQRRDEPAGQTLYRAGPGAYFHQERNVDIDARNASNGAPVWSETVLANDQFFLVPRAKWAVVGLFCLCAAVLMGISEWQMLLAKDGSYWAQDQQSANAANGANGANQNQQYGNGNIGERNNEAIIIGVTGLCTLAGVACIGYAAMPPRTTIAKGHSDVIENRRTSISTGTTQPNTRLGQEIEVV